MEDYIIWLCVRERLVAYGDKRETLMFEQYTSRMRLRTFADNSEPTKFEVTHHPGFTSAELCEGKLSRHATGDENTPMYAVNVAIKYYAGELYAYYSDKIRREQY